MSEWLNKAQIFVQGIFWKKKTLGLVLIYFCMILSTALKSFDWHRLQKHIISLDSWNLKELIFKPWLKILTFWGEF